VKGSKVGGAYLSPRASDGVAVALRSALVATALPGLQRFNSWWMIKESLQTTNGEGGSVRRLRDRGYNNGEIEPFDALGERLVDVL
jgi:hypothetical protein